VVQAAHQQLSATEVVQQQDVPSQAAALASLALAAASNLAPLFLYCLSAIASFSNTNDFFPTRSPYCDSACRFQFCLVLLRLGIAVQEKQNFSVQTETFSLQTATSFLRRATSCLLVLAASWTHLAWTLSWLQAPHDLYPYQLLFYQRWHC